MPVELGSRLGTEYTFIGSMLESECPEPLCSPLHYFPVILGTLVLDDCFPSEFVLVGKAVVVEVVRKLHLHSAMQQPMMKPSRAHSPSLRFQRT